MQQCEIRWRNFRSIEDTGWLKIRPLTIVIGANASGKTSLLAPLLVLKQSLDSRDPAMALKTMGELYNAGSYEDLIFRHETSRELTFALRDKTKPAKQSEPLREVPPAEFEVTFSHADGVAAPTLKRYVIRDASGQLLLSRKRLKSGKYSIEGPRLANIEEPLRTAIHNTPPERFLFTIGPVLTAFLEVHREAKKEAKGLEFEIQEQGGIYLTRVGYSTSWIAHLLSDVSYIGPLREYPSRLYELSAEHPADVGTRGQFAPEVLFRKRDPELLRLVNGWVKKFEFGFYIECKEVNPGAFTILLRRSPKSPSINLADAGFGLSQVLPLIVQSFYSKKGSLIIAEQPEIHLNPRLQALLADLFCEVASEGRSILVETHSEHIILRLRRLIAERKIKAEDVALYYAEKTEDRSTFREIPIKQNGHIEMNQWPPGFFEDTLREALGLAAAQTKGGSDAG